MAIETKCLSKIELQANSPCLYTNFIFLIHFGEVLIQTKAPNSRLVFKFTAMNAHELLPKTELNCPNGLELVLLGGGCFWCTEAVFLRLEGVKEVVPGYAGGFVVKPTYEAICKGTTGHAEVIQVTFDPKLISLETILAVFWATHDPTTLNRQGADVGPQYRSAVFYTNDAQVEKALALKEELNKSGIYAKPIVTEITPFTNFYSAELYHHNYYALHGQQPYCQFVVRPKVEKLQQLFGELLLKH
jgi:peptide-methionine (S)-S-oxide reductase